MSGTSSRGILRRFFRGLQTLVLVVLFIGCQDVIARTARPVVPTHTGPDASTPAPPTAPTAGQREIVILRTNDEHGFLLPTESKDFYEGGAAYAATSWLRKGCNPADSKGNVLLLSGGDSYTGSAISTWFRGESAVEAMNAMGYRASAVGNHEFDWGQDELAKRAQQARFPYLAANILNRDTGSTPGFVQPYAIVEVAGLRVGLIGLALKQTPDVTNARNVDGLIFEDYAPTLRKWVPEVRRKGAQIVLVESHICPDDLLVLAQQVADLGIAMFEGGHCHSARATSAGGALVAASSAHWNDYILTRLTVDVGTGAVTGTKQEIVTVLTLKSPTSPIKPEPGVQQVIDTWSQRTQLALGEVIGYTKAGLPQGSRLLRNLLVDSWLWAFPDADAALSNEGGFRQGIDTGEITLGEIVSVFPFENEIYQVAITGSQLAQAIAEAPEPMVLGGIRRIANGQIVLIKDGSALRPNEQYRVLINDYMYNNARYPFKRLDRAPYQTSALWRQPVADWIRAQHSDRDHPIELKISADAR